MYLFLGTVILLGLFNTVAANILGLDDYREGVSVWFRGIFRFDLHLDLMGAAPPGFQLHGLTATALVALWPCTRLVHVFSAHWATSPVPTSPTGVETTSLWEATPRDATGTVSPSVV